MRRLFFLAALLLLAPLAAQAQVFPAPPNVGLAANRPVNCVASNPGQPQEPQWYFATDTSVLSICVATNTWQNTTGGGGGGIGGGGTAGFLPEWTDSTTIANSLCQDVSTVLICGESVSVGANAFMISKSNAASGTTQFLAVTWDANRNALTAIPGNSVRGIAALGAGTSGTVQIAIGGEYPWTCDNQTVVNDWLVLSTTDAGECHDAGATEPTGVQNIAQVAGANTGSGTATLADIFTPDTVNAPAGPPTVIQVNGVPLASNTGNFNSTTSAAPANSQNLPFATDGLSPSGISAAVPQATAGQAGILQLATDLGGSYTAPNVVGIQGIPCTLSGTPVAGQVWGFTSPTACANLNLGVAVRSVSGNSDAILTGDREKNIRYTASSGATAVTIAQSGSAGFAAGFTFVMTNAQASGIVTLTPATSTINGASSLAIPAGNYAFVYSDGSNYFANGGIISGGSSITIPTSAHVLGSSSAPALQAATRTDIDAISYAAGGGSANAQTVTLAPAVGSLTTGLKVCWKPTAANSTTTPTLAVNGLTATTLIKVGGAALAANDLTTTAIACAIYDGTNFELQNPQTTTAAGITSINTSATGPAVSVVGAGSTNVTTSGNTVTVTGVNGPAAPNVNPISGTSYTIPNSDNSWRDVFTSGSAVAVTLPQANTISVAPFIASRYNALISSCTSCVTSSFSQSAGHTLIVGFFYQSSTQTTTNVTDSAGDTFQRLAPAENTGASGYSFETWYATGIAASASNAVTISTTGSVSADVAVLEYNVVSFDHSGSTSGSTNQNISVTLPITAVNEVALGFLTTQSACPSGWTSRSFEGDSQSDYICDKLLNSVATSTISSIISSGAFAALGQASFAISASPVFTAGWYVTLENAGTNLVTVTPTTSTINGQTTLVLVPNEACTVMSDGTNYNTICHFIPNEQTNGVIGAPVEIAGVNTLATSSDIGTTTLRATGATNAFYLAQAEMNCTTSTSTAVETLTLTYTDTSSTVQTATAQITCSTLGSASIASINLPFRAKASTNIQYGTVHTTAQATYDVSVALYQLATK